MPDPSSLTFLSRVNTVCIDVKEVHGGPKVPQREWLNFMKEDMELKSDMVVECNMHSLTDLLMVKFSSEVIFEEMLEKLKQGIPWKEKRGELVFGWSVHEALTNVKLINVSENYQTLILEKLAEFGRVVSSREGFIPDWPGVKDKSLIVKMKLKQGVKLPAFIEYGEIEDAVQVFCDSAERVCFRCLKQGHIAPYCRNRAKLASQIQSGAKSWASVVESGCPSYPDGPQEGQMKESGTGSSPSGLMEPPPPVAEVDPSPQGSRDPSIREGKEEKKTAKERGGRPRKNLPPLGCQDTPTLGPNATAYKNADDAWHKVVGNKNRSRDNSSSSVSSQKRVRKSVTVTENTDN